MRNAPCRCRHCPAPARRSPEDRASLPPPPTSAATAGMAHQRRIRMPASQANTPMCSALARQNSRKTAQPAAVAHTAMVRRARTGSSSRRRTSRPRRQSSPAGSGASGRASRAAATSSGASATGASHTRLNFGKRQDQQHRRKQRQQPGSAQGPPRFLADFIGHVGTAHQRPAEHHFEAERQAVIAVRLELRGS